MEKIINKIKSFLTRKPQLNIYKQLQSQHFLLRTGIATTAQILDITQEDCEVIDYVYLKLWVNMKIHNTWVRHHIVTLLNRKDIPSIGQTIHIKYSSEDISTVIIV